MKFSTHVVDRGRIKNGKIRVEIDVESHGPLDEWGVRMTRVVEDAVESAITDLSNMEDPEAELGYRPPEA